MPSLRLDFKKLLSLLKPKYIALTVSLLATLLLLISALLTYRSYQNILTQSLTIQALGIETVLQSLVKNFDLHFLRVKKNFLSNLIISERWQGVSYIALYSEGGTILLHSDIEQIGKTIEPFSIPGDSGKSYYLRQTSGEELFIYENKVRLEDKVLFLRIALHVPPVREGLGIARFHLLFEFILASFILLLGFASFLFLSYFERETKKMEELKNWQFITQLLLHEIKNPLATIKGFSQYLLTKVDDPKFKNPLELTLRESLRIERILKDLSIFSFPQTPLFTKTDLNDLLTEIKSNLEFLYPQIKIQLELLSEVKIFTDAHLLKSILFNLIDNAVSATLDAGESEILIRESQNMDKIIVEIIDRGKGIPDEIQEKVFEPFFTTKARGTGLGLAIVKKLSKTLGVKVTLKKAHPQGTCATVEIPKGSIT